MPAGTKLEPTALPVKTVNPESYKDGMLWLDGRRRLHQALGMVERRGGFVAKALTTP